MENTIIKENASTTKNNTTKKSFGESLRTNLRTARAKMASQKLSENEKLKSVTTAINTWLDTLPGLIAHCLTRCIITAIVLNVIAAYFWPELPETIPTVYEFFNGFLTFSEWVYKAALGGIASLFNGTFFEFGKSMMAELADMWNAFWTWASAIRF